MTEIQKNRIKYTKEYLSKMLNVNGNIKARQYRDTVSLYTVASIMDSYGHKVKSTPVLVTECPAVVSQLSGNRTMYLYQDAEIVAFEIRIRYVNANIKEVVWGDKTITIDSLENVDNRNREIVMTGKIKEASL